MKRILVPTSTGADWQRLLAQPTLHWKRGHSAMATAACWEANAPNLPVEIVDVLAASGDVSLTNLELLAAIPEWEVPLPGGERGSHTDVLAVARNDHGLVVLGVEAKVDEPFGPTVGEKRFEASAGQLDRLEYLERQLNVRSSIEDSIRYQLLHRTVSALLVAKAFHASIGVMLVQSFSPEGRWRADFDAFVAAVAATRMTDDLFTLPVNDNRRLLVGWCQGSREFLAADLPSAL